MRVLRIIGAAALACAAITVGPAAATAEPPLVVDGVEPTLVVDDVDYGVGEDKGPTVHWYTPTPDPSTATYGDVEWRGHGSEHLGTCGDDTVFESVHWVYNPGELLVISNIVCTEPGDDGDGNGDNGDGNDNDDNDGNDGNGEPETPVVTDPETPVITEPETEQLPPPGIEEPVTVLPEPEPVQLPPPPRSAPTRRPRPSRR